MNLLLKKGSTLSGKQKKEKPTLAIRTSFCYEITDSLQTKDLLRGIINFHSNLDSDIHLHQKIVKSYL